MKHLILILLTLTFFSLFAVSAFAQSGGSLYTFPKEQTIGINQVFSTDIVADTGANQAGGVGAILLYDPTVLKVDHIETGSAFDDYPIAAFDNESGKVSISGIVGSPDKLVSGVVTLAKVYWKAVAVGTDNVHFDFTQGSTTDSNIAVTSGSGDALSGVTDLKVTVVTEPQPGGITTSNTSSTTPTPQVVAATPRPFAAQITSFINKLLGREDTSQIDPYKPISALPPKTEFTTQGEATIAGSPSKVPLVLGVIMILAALAFLAFKLYKKQKNGAEPVHIAMGDNEENKPNTPIPPVPPVI